MPDLLDYNLCINHCPLKSKMKDAVGSLHYYCNGHDRIDGMNFEHTYITSFINGKLKTKDNPNFVIPKKCPYQLEHLLKRQE